LDLYDLVQEFDPDVIFHEASITDTTLSDQARMIEENVEPFTALAEMAADWGIKLVWASSAATYGIGANGAAEARRPFALEDAGRPANVYGFSKWLMENAARRTLAESPEAHIVGLRYFNVFGPGEQNKAHMASMIYRLAQQMLAGERPRIFHDGEQARDHVYVRDVVDATIAASGDAVAPGIYNVGSGQATTFNEVVAALNAALGTQHEPDYFDNPYSFYQDYTCADLSRTREGLGWSPKYQTLDAIAEYAAWLRAAKTSLAPSP
jgi:ADP-L-glycero-D-manno-heptose 6-epimerase